MELYRVVMGGSGGHRRLTGGSDDFSLQTNRQTLHHNIYIIKIIVIIEVNINVSMSVIDIIKIEEVDHIYTLKFRLVLEW